VLFDALLDNAVWDGEHLVDESRKVRKFALNILGRVRRAGLAFMTRITPFRNEGRCTCDKSQRSIQRITWAEVASVLEFRNGDHIAVLYRPFIDDCSDQKQEEIVAVGAVIASHRNWGPIRKKWNMRLRQAGLKYFRSTEYFSLRGQFDVFRDPKKYPKPKGSEAAKVLRDDLEAILRDSSAVVGIGFAIPLRLYRWFRDTVPGAKEKFGGDAYYSALQTLMIECAYRSRRTPVRSQR
jgi:hypothetical protein